MISFQQRKPQVLRLFNDAIALGRKRTDQAVIDQLTAAAKHLEDGKLLVVVAGEFKQGKSSLINALINEPGLFPVDIDITTNLVSTITYGQQETISVLLGERGKEKVQMIQRNEIPDYVTEQRNRSNARQARMLVMETPNSELKQGLVLVDTPGVGGLNVEHTEVAYAFIPNADAVLFVSDAFAPLSSKELDFVKLISRHCQNLIFVVTKADAAEDYHTIVANNREKLSQVLATPNLSIIPVSSRAKLSYLKSQDSEDLEDSNFAALEQQLWQLLNQQRGQILLGRALGELGRCLAELHLPLRSEWEAYQQHTQAELNRLEQQFEEARSRSQELLNNSAAWRTRMSDGLTDIRSNVMETFQAGFAQIRVQTEAYLEDDRLIDNPEQIAGLVEVDIDALVTQLGEELSHQAARLHAQLEASTGLNLNPYEVDVLTWEKGNCQSIAQMQRAGWWEKTLSVTRSSMFNGTTGSTIGGLIGGVVGAGIGLLLGGIGAGPGAYIGSGIGAAIAGVSGLTTGARQGLRQIREQDRSLARREISRIIKPYIDQAQRSCNAALNETSKQLERSMRDELTTQIKRSQEVYERSLKSIQNSRRLSQEQATLKAAELSVPLQQVSQLQQATEALTKAVMEHSTVSPPEPDESNDYGDWADD